MELNGKQVEGEVFPSTNISTREIALMVQFSDGAEAKVGDVLLLNDGEKRLIEQEVASAGRDLVMYRLSQNTI